MADGRRRDEWRRTARICSTMANIHRDRKSKPSPYTDDDFNDYAITHQEIRIKAPITILKSIFLGDERN